jgi:hypothetical protein
MASPKLPRTALLRFSDGVCASQAGWAKRNQSHSLSSHQPIGKAYGIKRRYFM